jgi:hypothetical protein
MSTSKRIKQVENKIRKMVESDPTLLGYGVVTTTEGPALTCCVIIVDPTHEISEAKRDKLNSVANQLCNKVKGKVKVGASYAFQDYEKNGSYVVPGGFGEDQLHTTQLQHISPKERTLALQLLINTFIVPFDDGSAIAAIEADNVLFAEKSFLSDCSVANIFEFHNHIRDRAGAQEVAA